MGVLSCTELVAGREVVAACAEFVDDDRMVAAVGMVHVDHLLVALCMAHIDRLAVVAVCKILVVGRAVAAASEDPEDATVDGRAP